MCSSSSCYTGQWISSTFTMPLSCEWRRSSCRLPRDISRDLMMQAGWPSLCIGLPPHIVTLRTHLVAISGGVGYSQVWLFSPHPSNSFKGKAFQLPHLQFKFSVMGIFFLYLAPGWGITWVSVLHALPSLQAYSFLRTQLFGFGCRISWSPLTFTRQK